MSKPWSYRQQFCGFNSAPDCQPLPGCGNKAQATAYFISFILCIVVVFRSVLVAVVVEAFIVRWCERASCLCLVCGVVIPLVMSSEFDKAIFAQDDFEKFRKVWLEYDSQGEGLLPWRHAEEILAKLSKQPNEVKHHLLSSTCRFGNSFTFCGICRRWITREFAVGSWLLT
jgi:hypothetical protein